VRAPKTLDRRASSVVMRPALTAQESCWAIAVNPDPPPERVVTGAITKPMATKLAGDRHLSLPKPCLTPNLEISND